MKLNEVPESFEMVEKEAETESLKGRTNNALSQFKLDHFSGIVKIGDGGEGRVYRATCKKKSRYGFREVALKELKRRPNLKGIPREIELLAKIRHPHVVQLFGIILDESNFTAGYVMEYMKMGSLYKVIHDLGIKYEMGKVYSWIYQAALGLQYLHEQNILHRDIKPQNMLLGESCGQLKLADFGLAKETTVTSFTGGVGTILYMAPEVIQGTSYSASADVYSLTITIWEMIHRRRPFGEEEDSSNFKIASDVKNGRRPKVFIVDIEMENLLHRGWHEDPFKRISVSELILVSETKLMTDSPAEPKPLLCAKQNTMNVGDYNSCLVPQSEKSVFDISKSMKSRRRKQKERRKAVGIVVALVVIAIGIWIILTNTLWREKAEEKANRTEELVEPLHIQAAVNQSGETILIMGGRNKRDLDDMIVFDTNARQWTTLSLKLPYNISYGGSAYLNGEIYIFGGRGLLKKMYKLDSSKGKMKWIELTYMDDARINIQSSSLTYGECIWVFGGWSPPYGTLNTVEKYCNHSNKWMTMPNLNTYRYGAAAAVHSGNIIISGGGQIFSFPEEVKQTPFHGFKTVEFFKTKTWSPLMDMPARRASHSMISFGDNLIVIGGYDNNFLAYNTVWSFNLEANNWTDLPSLKEKRHSHSVATFNNEVFVIGGYDEGPLETVEIFNGTAWRSGPSLPSARCEALSVKIPTQLAEDLVKYQSEKLNIRSFVYFFQILVMGGWNKRRKLNELVLLDTNTFQWKTLPFKLPRNFAFGSSVYLNEEIYIFGADNWPKKMFKLNTSNMQWIELAEMNEPRDSTRSSSLIFQGCIWVFGGWNGTNVLSSVEKYSPEKNEWLQMPPMTTRRQSPAAVVYNEKIIIAGGWGPERSSGTLRTVESYDPISGNWSILPDMPAPRADHSMISIGDSIIVVGGVEKSIVACNTVWSLTLGKKNMSWVDLPSLQEARHTHSVVALNNELFVIGGLDEQPLRTIEIFNGTAWRAGPDLPSERWAASSVVIPLQLTDALMKYQPTESPEDKIEMAEPLRIQSTSKESEETILVLGGRNKRDLDDMIVFDTNARQWKTLPLKLPYRNSYGGSAYLNGEIYIFGGEQLLRKTYKLDVSQEKWIELAEMNESRDSISSSSFVLHGCIWVFGGWNGTNDLKTGEKYCPEIGKWTLATEMKTAHAGIAATVHNGKVVISGGWGYANLENTTSKTVESYDTISEIWSSFPDMPAPRATHSINSIGDHLIIIGGLEEKFKSTDSAWNIGEENSSWKRLPSMKQSRQSHSAVVANSKLFVIGGEDDDDALRNVEIFDGTNWWFGPDLPSGRWGMSSVVIPKKMADVLLNIK